MDGTLVCAIVGSLVTVGAAITQYNKEKKANKEAEESKVEERRSKEELKVANNKILELTQEIAKRSENLVEANQKIADMQGRSLNEITGGKNLPVLVIGHNGSGQALNPLQPDGRLIYKGNIITFLVVNGGKYTIKDASVSIKDIYNKDNKEAITPYNYMKQVIDQRDWGTYKNILIGTLALKSRKHIYSSTMPDHEGYINLEYDVVVEWSNGLYQQHITIAITPDKTDIKSIYYDADGNIIPYEQLENAIKE
ncbi:hypothetical protein SAMN05421788_11669 [Filimonas lacunae]|uniref:Uncharacterized protein n=1 Tax=Filimonas lacunae TaxID=477680 RepID=A0A1N7RH41_9BACT|nr:hypothetical protein [Filimonas lacunae]SIT34460.1 hypothetical protein SAMN05421788_11669 [Filimonas lacunae]